MNVVKKVLIALFATIVVLALASYLLPSRVRVERSTTISASPETIYESVATLNTWKDWTAWNSAKYPNMKREYKGPDTGVGAEMTWTDPGGDGRVTITKADPNEGIEYDFKFADFPPLPGHIQFTPVSKGDVKVTWFFEDTAGWNPLSRYFCFFFMDRMIGPDFEKGLAGLKQRVEGSGGELQPATDLPSTESPPAEQPAESAPTVKQE